MSYFACVCSVMQYGSETWSAYEDGMIRLEKNMAGLVR